MGKENTNSQPMPVPAGRLSRALRLGAMATSVAGSAAIGGARHLGTGNRPELRDLVLTPVNLRRLADELARMRGAAMKIGQMISMDAGDVLPPEVSEIFARLRADAHFMPPRQLKKTLNASWGENWLREFENFNVRPIAAASIGQVHRARLRDGRDVAIKVQYPGIARSIDSDIANVGALIRLSGLLPKGFDLAPYLEEARRQLREETDYLREGQKLRNFGSLLSNDARFCVPEFQDDWSTQNVLVMSFAHGAPIEEAALLPPDTRNQIAQDLINLLLRDLFDFGTIQSDPNFANYRYNSQTNQIVLLDFGATRHIDPKIVRHFRSLFRSGLDGDLNGIRNVAHDLGVLTPDVGPEHGARVLDMITTVFDAVRRSETFDFADTAMSRKLQRAGMELAEDGFVPEPPPMDVLYVQRKIGGIFLLASRLRAQVPVRNLLNTQFAPF